MDSWSFVRDVLALWGVIVTVLYAGPIFNPIVGWFGDWYETIMDYGTWRWRWNNYRLGKAQTKLDRMKASQWWASERRRNRAFQKYERARARYWDSCK